MVCRKEKTTVTVKVNPTEKRRLPLRLLLANCSAIPLPEFDRDEKILTNAFQLKIAPPISTDGDNDRIVIWADIPD